MKNFIKKGVLCSTLLLSINSIAAPIEVLWFDSTPEYGSQAPDALREDMSEFIDSFGDGSIYNSTYVSGQASGVLASTLASATFDVIVFDSTWSVSSFSADDLTAVQAFYADGKDNLLLDGSLYIRSINYNADTIFPGPNGSTGGLTINEVDALATRGGGIMIGTDHNCCQANANQILNALVPGAGFSGVRSPSTDGVFYGTDLLDGPLPIAAADILQHWSTEGSQGQAPSGVYTDFLGTEIELFSQVSIADSIGGPLLPFITTSWAPGEGTTDVDDDTVGGDGGDDDDMTEVNAPGSLILLSMGLLAVIRRRRNS